VTDPIRDAMAEGIEDARVVPMRERGKRDLTQDGLALELGDRWERDARYVAAWNRWLFFDGHVWRTDDRLEHMTRAREYLREVAESLSPELEGTKKALWTMGDKIGWTKLERCPMVLTAMGAPQRPQGSPARS